VFFLNHLKKEIYLKKTQVYFKNQTTRQIYYKSFFERHATTVISQSYSKFKRINRIFKLSMFFDACKKLIVIRNKRVSDLRQNINLGRKVKLFQQATFFKSIKKKISLKKRLKIFKARSKCIAFARNFLIFVYRSLKNKFRVFKTTFNKTIHELKNIIDEKSEYLRSLEYDNNEVNIHYKNLLEKNMKSNKENDNYRQIIINLELKIEDDNTKFNQLWEQNLQDIKNLQDTLTNNERILNEALVREESMQNKYCSDIENAITLNKQLNSIVARKNNQVSIV